MDVISTYQMHKYSIQITTHLLPVRNFEFISDKFKVDEI